MKRIRTDAGLLKMINIAGNHRSLVRKLKTDFKYKPTSRIFFIFIFINFFF